MNRYGITWLCIIVTHLVCAQEPTINYSADQIELVHVLEELKDKYDLHFSYSVTELEGKFVTISSEEEPLSSFLKTVLSTHDLNFKIVEKNFIAVSRQLSRIIQIQLFDKDSGEKLAFLRAQLQGEGLNSIEHSDGEFTWTVNSISDNLEVSAPGYETLEVDLSTISDDSTMNLFLVKLPYELDEVVVKDDLVQGIIVDDVSSKMSILTQDMEIMPGLSERDVLWTVQMLSGIGSADESASGINVRGSSRDKTAIYWNDIPIYQSAHYFGHVSAFIPSSTGRVDVHKNNIPVKYGNATAGLLQLHSRIDSVSLPDAELNLNFTHADMYFQLPSKKRNIRILVAGRRSFNDLWPSPTFNSLSTKVFSGSPTEDTQRQGTEDFKYNNTLVFSDFNTVVDFDLSPKSNVMISTLYSINTLEYESENQQRTVSSRQTLDAKNSGGNVKWLGEWSNTFSTEISSSYVHYHKAYVLSNFRTDEEGGDDSAQKLNHLRNWENRFTVNFAPMPGHKITSGYQVNGFTSGLKYEDESEFGEEYSEHFFQKSTTVSAFFDYQGQVYPGLSLGAGFRYNRYVEYSQSSWDRQVRVNYQVSDEFLLKTSVGKYQQYTSSIKESEFIFSNTIEHQWIIPNETYNIGVTTNQQFTFGGLFRTQALMVDLDTYMKKVNSIIDFNFGPELKHEGLFIQQGIDQVKGFDLTVNRKWKRYQAWLSYSFQDSNVITVPDLPKFPASLSIRHQLQISNTYNLKGFEFSAGFTLKSGLPYTPVLGIVWDEEFSEDFPFDIAFGDFNSERLPIYRRFDMSAWYRFAVGKQGINGQFGVSVINVLNHRNLYSRTFTIEQPDDDRSYPVINTIERAMIGFTPNLSLKLSI